MKNPNEETNIEELLSKVNESPFYRTISMEMLEANEKGSVVRIRSDVKHKNLWGTTHGGVIASLIDSSCGLSVAPYLKDGETLVTISLHIDYIASVIEGNLYGQGRMIHRGSRLARSEAVITNEDEKLVAKGYASFMITSSNLKNESNNGNVGQSILPKLPRRRTPRTC
jgi:acyl-CoA thioesterase